MNSQKNEQDSLSHQEIVFSIQQRLNQIAVNDLSMTGPSLKQLMNIDYVDRILGCLFGAFMGDALGSYCQFQTKDKIANKIQKAIQMPGGGPFNTKPGQVTDDSQMALHLLQGLQIYNGQKSLAQQINLILISIGKQYVSWYNSMPFDIGNTCSTAVQKLSKKLKPQQQSPTTIQNQKQQFQRLQKAFKEIDGANSQSQSNGFLMRITPMACFAALIKIFKENDINHLNRLIQGQILMTHSHKQCIEAGNTYIEVLCDVILRKNHEDLLKIQQKLEEKYQKNQKMNSVHQGIYLGFSAHKTNTTLLYSDRKNIGFYQFAYYFTFYALRQLANLKQQQINASVFKNLIGHVIQQGGDTDTNACIAGGLVGSVLGFKKLPAEYVRKQLVLRLGQNPFRINEQAYEPSRGFINIIKLIKKFVKN